MKNIAVTLVLMLVMAFFSVAQTQHAEGWLTNFEQAKKEATEKGRKVLVSFTGSDWCGNCKRLEIELFQSEEFKAFAKDNLVLLNLDFPAKKKNKLSEELTAQNAMLFEKYNKSNAYPAVYVVDSEGKLIGKMNYPQSTVSGYLSSIKSLIQ